MPKWHKMLTKAVSHFCPTLNERSHNCQRLFKYCQNGEISPNLAALFVKYLSGSYAFQLSQITFSSGARHSVTKRIKHFCPLPTQGQVRIGRYLPRLGQDRYVPTQVRLGQVGTYLGQVRIVRYLPNRSSDCSIT